MKELVLTPFNEDGYLKLASYLRRVRIGVLLPLPRAYCESRADVVESSLPASIAKIWRPVAELLIEGLIERPICYLGDEEVKEMVNFGVKLAILVHKARVFGKVDPNEWVSLVSNRTVPRFTGWYGTLVVDRFSEYYLMVKAGVEADRVVQVELFAPTPLDLLYLCSNRVSKCQCSVEEVALWVVKYIGEYVIPSPDTSTAYRRLVNSREYREFIARCAPDDEVLHYWMWAVPA